MSEPIFQGYSVKTRRIIYTPSSFAKSSLYHLQEVGELHALQSHTSSREGLISYLFFIVTEGSGELYYDGTTYSLKTGDCIFINCRRSYSHTSSSTDLWNLKWVHFNGPLLNNIYDKYIERGGRPVFHPQNLTQYDDVVESLLTIASSDDHIRDMRINEKISSLLTLFMSESWNPDNKITAGAKKQSLQDIKQYLDEHYPEHLSLDQLADTFYINKYYLTRVFKEQYGITIITYLDRVRITHAKQLLRYSDLTAEEIGLAIGISEPGYFNRVFKKIEGITPGEYRKMW